MSPQELTEKDSLERANYFEVPGAHLYTVLHVVANPIIRLLLIGPFASERHNSYLAWIRWARYLAVRQIEVLRFDYRCIGESTGEFENFRFDDCLKDVQRLGMWLKDQPPAVPLVLLGFEMGALFAGRVFSSGIGDALVLWSPPSSANQSLRLTFVRWIKMKQLFTPASERKPASFYFQQLENNKPVRVEGYLWSSDFWRDSFDLILPSALAGSESATAAYGRPVKIFTLDRSVASRMKAASIGYEEVKDLDEWFAVNFGWLTSAVAPTSEVSL